MKEILISKYIYLKSTMGGKLEHFLQYDEPIDQYVCNKTIYEET